MQLVNKQPSFLSSLSTTPYPHNPQLEFPVNSPVQTPTLVWKTLFEDEHKMVTKERKQLNKM